MWGRHRWFLLNNKISPFMIYLHLQNRLISNRHCSTYYNKLLNVCGGEGYCELLVNFADFLFIVHAILLFIPGTSIVGMRERGVQIQ